MGTYFQETYTLNREIVWTVNVGDLTNEPVKWDAVRRKGYPLRPFGDNIGWTYKFPEKFFPREDFTAHNYPFTVTVDSDNGGYVSDNDFEAMKKEYVCLVNKSVQYELMSKEEIASGKTYNFPYSERTFAHGRGWRSMWDIGIYRRDELPESRGVNPQDLCKCYKCKGTAQCFGLSPSGWIGRQTCTKCKNGLRSYDHICGYKPYCGIRLVRPEESDLQ